MQQPIKLILTSIKDVLIPGVRRTYGWKNNLLTVNIYFGRSLAGVPAGSIVIFPYPHNTLCCGIAAIVSYKYRKSSTASQSTALLKEMLTQIQDQGCQTCKNTDYSDIDQQYLGGKALIDSLWQTVQSLKSEERFFPIYMSSSEQEYWEDLAKRLNAIIEGEEELLADRMGRLAPPKVTLMSLCLERLKDIAWCIRNEILSNIV